MIASVSIKNFKSIVNLELPLGRINVLIGENGCGKSNILEGITFGAAAATDRLGREFLVNRGIRVTEPAFMYSAFEGSDEEIIIEIYNSELDDHLCLHIKHNNEAKPRQWELLPMENKASEFFRYWDIESLKDLLEHFLIYSLEESVLRRFDVDTGIFPFGRNGGGLLAYLKELSRKEDGDKILAEIQENLLVIDWFESLEIPKTVFSQDFTIHVKDRYISETLQTFDQRSTNEGFLYLLFYLTLFISDETPAFFAIDNIESALNPKMCREVMKRFTQLARKHNKQVIMTTHSPSVLDGLNIDNDDERLFVVRRNIDGHTKINRVKYNNDRMDMPLSEAWVDGYLGGLPENF
ncbi:DNA replication and repair protein RecF [termite gut metagenome]|uniref:DNA replication and repair protein RecF n=1 Tax=termite gut metagenome TaxID=433724 RepID=A0A5J4R6I8_9ZZZZ